MSEKNQPKKRGQPHKDELYKATKKVTIYLTTAQVAILEEKAMQRGYSPKDKGKWLKDLVIAPKTEILESGELKEIAILKEKLKSCQALIKQKNEMIELLKR